MIASGGGRRLTSAWTQSRVFQSVVILYQRKTSRPAPAGRASATSGTAVVCLGKAASPTSAWTPGWSIWSRRPARWTAATNRSHDEAVVVV